MSDAAGHNDRWHIDTTKASVARLYDYCLGGKDNFAVDRAMAAKLIEEAPDIPITARMIKQFGARGVDYVARQGIRQFIDLGSGIPTSPPSVHEVARKVAMDCNVVYVDYDRVVVAHGQALRDTSPGLATILGDIGEPDTILNHPELRSTIDFDKPVGLLLCSVLQTIPDLDDAIEVMRRYRSRLAPGSYLVLSHAHTTTPPQIVKYTQDTAAKHGYPFPAFRTDDEILRLFEGFDLVDPGLVDVKDWHPLTDDGEDDDVTIPTINLRGAVARLNT